MTDDIRALLFDLGGVLVDIEFGRIFAHWAAASGVAQDEIRRRFYQGDAYARHERSELTAAEYFSILRQQLGISLDDAAFTAGWNALFTGEMPGARELLVRAARRYPLYVFSNTNPTHTAFWLHEYRELLAPVRRVFTSHDIGLRKPDEASFHHVAEAIGAAPHRIAFFDDLAENVEGARRAGMKAWHVSARGDLAHAVSPLLHAGPDKAG